MDAGGSFSRRDPGRKAVPALAQRLVPLLAVLALTACASRPQPVEPGASALGGGIFFPSRPIGCDQTDDDTMISAAQNVLEETTCNSALWLDSLGGDQGNLDAARRTHGYVETTASYSRLQGFESRTRARVRFELPNWEKRLSAFAGRDDEEDFVRDRTEQFAVPTEFPTVGEDDQWLAGLGYSLPESERVQTDFRIGAASLRHPRVFVQGRVLVHLYSDARNLIYARDTVFWNSRLGFGTTFGLDYTRVLSRQLLFRLAQSGTISERSEGLDWTSSAILYQKLGQDRGISGEAFIRGGTDTPEPLTQYGVRSILGFPIIRNRLIGELLAGYNWRQDTEPPWEGSYVVGLGLKLPFGRKEE